MMKTAFALLVLLIAPASVSAQEAPRLEVFGGYSYERAAGGLNTNGAEASVTVYLTDWLGIEGAVTGQFGSVSGTEDPRFLDDFPPGIPIRAGTTLDIPHYNAHVDDYSFMAGPHVAFRGARVTPFARALVGAVHRTAKVDVTALVDTQDSRPPIPPFLVAAQDEGSETSFGVAVGAGVDVRLTDGLSLRAIQAGYLLTRFRPAVGFLREAESQGSFRLSTGVLFRW